MKKYFQPKSVTFWCGVAGVPVPAEVDKAIAAIGVIALRAAMKNQPTDQAPPQNAPFRR